MKHNFCKTIPLSLMVILTGCSFEKDISKNSVAFDPNIVEIEHDYSEILEYQIKWENIFKIEVENYYVYFYSLSCSNCQEIKNFMIERALERKDIYFIKSSNEIPIQNDVKSTIGAQNVVDFAILGYPALIKIEDGKCTKNIAGKSQILTLLK